MTSRTRPQRRKLSRRLGRLLRRLSGFSMVLLLSVAPSAAQQPAPEGANPDANVKMYEGPVEADDLARKLFPPKMRSIVAVQPEPEVVGLPIQFAFDSAELLPESKPFLDEVGKMMQLERLAEAQLLIEGHTDGHGPADYNAQLSMRRANAVAKYLVTKHSVQPKRLVTQGKGESDPLPGTRATDRQNRRVQFGAR